MHQLAVDDRPAGRTDRARAPKLVTARRAHARAVPVLVVDVQLVIVVIHHHSSSLDSGPKTRATARSGPTTGSVSHATKTNRTRDAATMTGLPRPLYDSPGRTCHRPGRASARPGSSAWHTGCTCSFHPPE